MNNAALAHMANQIGHYYQAYGSDEAVAGIQSHIRRFWHPDLRAQLIALAEREDSTLLPSVRTAAQGLLRPST